MMVLQYTGNTMVAVTSKFQATLPKPVREWLNVKAGDKIMCSLETTKRTKTYR